MFRFKAPARAGMVDFIKRGHGQRAAWMLVALFSIFPLAVCSSTAVLAQANNATPSGTKEIKGVVNNALAQPLAGAKLMLKDAGGGIVAETQSDASGRFVFSGIAPGTYALVAEQKGFQQGTSIVTVGDGPVAEIALTMTSEQALDVHVAVERLDRSRNGISVKTGSSQYSFRQEDIKALPEGESTAFNQLLLRAPGVANDNFGQLHIRGDHADIQYRIDGVILPEGISGFGSALDTRFANSVNLLTGALPAQYGYRTAGVVEIETKSAYETGGEISYSGGDHGTVNPAFQMSGAKGPVNFYVSGSFLQNNLGLENPTGNVNALHDRTDQVKGFAYFSVLPNPDTRVSLMLGTYQGKFQIPNAPGATPDPNGNGFTTGNGGTSFDSAALNENQREVNRYAVLALQSTLGEKIDYQVALFQRYTSLHFTPDPIGDPIFTGAASELFKSDSATGIQGDASLHLNERHTLRSGLFLSNERVESNNTSTVFPVDNNGNVTGPAFVINDNNPKGGNRLFGLYLQDEWKATDKLTVNYGLRYDYMNEFVKAQQFSPRLGAVYQWSSQTTLHAGYSRYFTPPPTELVSSQSIGLFANTSLAPPLTQNDPVQPERTNYYDLGMLHRLNPALSIGADAYYKDVSDLLDEGQFGPAPIFTPFNYQKGRVYGLELTANYQKDNWSGYINLARSVAQGKNIISSQASSGFQPNELAFIANNWVHLDHDQTYTATGGVTYRQGKTLYSVDVIYGSGLSTTVVTPNDQKLPSYVTANLGITHDFETGELGKIQARLAVINIADKTYELRDGTGIGVGPPAFGPRRAFYAGITKSF